MTYVIWPAAVSLSFNFHGRVNLLMKRCSAAKQETLAIPVSDRMTIKGFNFVMESITFHSHVPWNFVYYYNKT